MRTEQAPFAKNESEKIDLGRKHYSTTGIRIL